MRDPRHPARNPDRLGGARNRQGLPPLTVRLYRRSLGLLPPRVREEDGEEMAWVFERIWGEPRGAPSRALFALGAFWALPWVALSEWMEETGWSPAPGPGPRPRRAGMTPWMNNLLVALRSLRKAPAFTLTTVILLALGIGSVTTIFTLVDHVILRPLPYPEPQRLVLIENGSHSGVFFRDVQELASVEMWGAARGERANLTGVGDPLQVQQVRVSRDFFAVLGARPALGRLFVEDDFLAPAVTVLSHDTWVNVFGADPDIVDRRVELDGNPLTVVGVLSPEFVPPEDVGSASTDFWLPLDWNDEIMGRIDYWILEVVGRMAPGATVADVQAEVDRLAQDLAHRFPDDFVTRDGDPRPLPVSGLQEVSTRDVRPGFNLILGATALLLLVACLNVAHLFLARGIGRVRDMAVRRALGAGTRNLVQQLLVESLLVGAAGGLLGVGLAAVGLRSFLTMNPTRIPWSQDVTLDPRIMAFAGMVSLGTVLLFGLVPALRSMGRDLTDDLKGTSRSSTSTRGGIRLRGGLVVMEVALSLILVTGAGLLVRSFMRLHSVDPVIQVEGLWTIPLNPTETGTPEDYRLAMDRVEEALASTPGVANATYGLTMPYQWTDGGRCCWSTRTIAVEGEEPDPLRIFIHPVSETYFATLNVPLLYGEGWSEAEAGLDPWPAVLNEGFAEEVFGDAQRAVGQVAALGADATPIRVVGVAADVPHYGLDQGAGQDLYIPVEKLPFAIPLSHMAVRIRGDPPVAFSRTLREAVWQASPDLPVPTVRSMEEWIQRSTAAQRFFGVLFAAFGVVGLVMAAGGLYGTLLYNVGQRRRELGIRMALGAAAGRVEGEVVRRGFLLALAGCVLGGAGAWAGSRLLQSWLFEVTPGDPITFAGAIGILLMVAVVASWLPARRAGRTDPLETLKAE